MFIAVYLFIPFIKYYILKIVWPLASEKKKKKTA